MDNNETTTKTKSPDLIAQSFDDAEFMQKSRDIAASISGQNIDKKLTSKAELPRKKHGTVKTVAVVALIGAGVLGGKAIYEQVVAPPTFSSETTTYTVNPGDGLLNAAEQIKGLRDNREGVSYIVKMPENQEVLSDGLQPGETLVIPVSASK